MSSHPFFTYSHRIPEGLSSDEQEAFRILQQNNGRIEQEHLAHNYILQTLAQMDGERGD